ncbi:hypothetical protein ANN_23900 [Periplaneta americana]|uniref:Reverse transcriptase n=1 Tax=Periplaneta americana TaxID=6978 RepID=A0ABQ8S1Z2_PERAM|nr:hypothetical protein ANN_23900 [Periplaneta americana]
MSPGSSTESYPAFARIGLRKNPEKNLNQVTCPDRDSNPGHLVSRPDAMTVTPQLVGRPEGKRPFGRPRRRWEDNIKMDLREVGYDDRDWINVVQDRDRWRAYNPYVNSMRPLMSELNSSCQHLSLPCPVELRISVTRKLREELRNAEFESCKVMPGRGRGENCTAKYLKPTPGFLISLDYLHLNGHGCQETETLAHVQGQCNRGLLLRSARHHHVRSLIANALRKKSWIVEEEVFCLATNGSSRRIDIIAYSQTTKKGYIIDPTIRIETGSSQPEDVNQEKINIYLPTVDYFKAKYQLEDIEVIGLLIGARGVIPKFFESFKKTFELPQTLTADIITSVLKRSCQILNYRNYLQEIMSRVQNIVRNGNIKIGDLSFEKVEKFKYLGATVTNINDTREEIKRRINMGNVCYYSVEKLLSSSLLSKNLKVRIYKTVILPVLLYGCETWTLTLREEHRFRVFENKVLRKIFGAKRDEVTGEWRKLHNTELHAFYSSPDIIRNIKSRRLRWAGHVARMGESRNAYRVLVGRPEGKRPLGRPRRRWEDNIKMDLRKVGYDDGDWINLAQDRDRWRAYVTAAMNLRVP